MKRLVYILSLLLFAGSATAQTAQDSIALTTATWEVMSLSQTARCQRVQIELFGSKQTISVIRYRAKRHTTRIVALDHQGAATSEFGRQHKALAAVNGSYFNVKTLAPTTFLMIDRQVLGRTEPEELMRVNGIVAWRDKLGRRIEIFACDTARYQHIARNYRSAIAAGPLLVARGQQLAYPSQQGFYAKRHPRTVIGYTQSGEVLLLVIDGRFPAQAEGTTIAETAYIARQLGMVDALNLDGGGSSALWSEPTGIVNHPYDNKRFDHAGERKVPNSIVVE